MTNLPVGNYGNDPPESPHSTRSAPWSTSGRSRGLYNVSPKSIKNQRSCSSIQNLQKTSIRSSSVDSQSSNDSRCCKRFFDLKLIEEKNK